VYETTVFCAFKHNPKFSFWLNVVLNSLWHFYFKIKISDEHLRLSYFFRLGVDKINLLALHVKKELHCDGAKMKLKGLSLLTRNLQSRGSEKTLFFVGNGGANNVFKVEM
jgi:hypothetical protein